MPDESTEEGKSLEEPNHTIEIWKKCIDVQQHFNDLELRIRNYAVTMLVAILGLVAFAIKEHMLVTLWGYDFRVGSLLAMSGLFGWIAFYLMDRLWYHRLLYGAVKHADQIEKRNLSRFPSLGLTGAIGRESPIAICGWKIHTTAKIDLFYVLGCLLIIGVALVVQVSPTTGGSASQNLTSAAHIAGNGDSGQSPNFSSR